MHGFDADLVPLAMQMCPGNESEKPYIRKIVEEMKPRYKVSRKTVQVADKGLNCTRNIYAAVKEADDGYIFSKSIHGRGQNAKTGTSFFSKKSRPYLAGYLLNFINMRALQLL